MNGPAAIHPQLLPHVLSSWKEIATFLGKGVRTVQRWESSLGLPVHRPSEDSGVVLAYPVELDEWCHKQWKNNKSVNNAKLAADARPADSDDVLQFVLALANSCSELNRKIRTLQGKAAGAKPVTFMPVVQLSRGADSDIEQGKRKTSMRNLRSSPHYKPAS